MLIETFLGKIWEEYVNTLNRPNQEEKSLKDHRSWTTYHYIEVLSTVGIMQPKVRVLLHKLRKKRNQIVHEKGQVNQDESYWCIRAADSMIKNKRRRFRNPFQGIEHNHLLKLWNLI